MPITTFSLDGTNLEDYGLVVTDARGWLSFPQRDLKMVGLAQRDGRKVLTTISPVAPRTLGLGFRLEPSSLSDRRTKLNALFKALRGRIEIKSVEDSTKSIFGYLQEAPVSTFGSRPLTLPQVKTDLQLVCPDPYWYDSSAQTLTLASAGVDYALSMGDSSAVTRRISVKINGTFTSPVTVVLKTSGGVEISRMTLALAKTSPAYVTIDCDAYTIVDSSSVDQIATLTSTHDFFKFDPSTAGKMTVDKGDAVVTYYRAYAA